MLGQDLCVVMWRSGGTGPSMGQTFVTVDEGHEDGVSKENELVEQGQTNNFLASQFCIKLEVMMEGMGKKEVLVEYRLKKQEKGARVSGNTGIRILVDVGFNISCGSSFQMV